MAMVAMAWKNMINLLDIATNRSCSKNSMLSPIADGVRVPNRGAGEERLS